MRETTRMLCTVLFTQCVVSHAGVQETCNGILAMPADHSAGFLHSMSSNLRQPPATDMPLALLAPSAPLSVCPVHLVHKPVEAPKRVVPACATPGGTGCGTRPSTKHPECCSLLGCQGTAQRCPWNASQTPQGPAGSLAPPSPAWCAQGSPRPANRSPPSRPGTQERTAEAADGTGWAAARAVQPQLPRCCLPALPAPPRLLTLLLASPTPAEARRGATGRIALQAARAGPAALLPAALLVPPCLLPPRAVPGEMCRRIRASGRSGTPPPSPV